MEYNCLNNTSITTSHLDITCDNRKNTNLYKLFFVELDDKPRVCQFYDKIEHTICHEILTFKDEKLKQKNAARASQHHMNNKHGVYINDTSAVFSYLCPSRPNVKRLEKKLNIQGRKRKVQQTLTKAIKRAAQNKSKHIIKPRSVFDDLVSLAVMSGLSHSFFDSRFFKYFVAKYFPECKGLLDRKKVSKHINASGTMVRNASSVIGATDSFKGDKNYPFFDSHNGCAVHQIQLFAKDLIDDIMENLDPNTETVMSTSAAEDIESAPQSCSPNVVQRPINLSTRLRNCSSLQRNFRFYVTSLPPLYCNTRWNSIFYLLEHLLKNLDEYKDFYRNLDIVDESFSSFSESDLSTAKTLFKGLAPYESLTKLLSLNKPGSICHFSLLMYCQEIALVQANKLSEILGRPVKFQKFEAKFEKYFAKTCAPKCYIHLISALFHYDGMKVVEFSKTIPVNPYSELADLAFRILNIKLTGNECEAGNAISTNGCSDYARMKYVEGISFEDDYSEVQLTLSRTLKES
ncbi:Rsf1p KNAG_0G00430 [Huiozyma naganishii CBS 8797]|uniref:Uncharacterized protein n=1 Tax=Huiozyma naganishii (strain ATCC MYA-139 / BCRC 22969 / CBS 8797 / KCTC 17520 / NBRC 10181 / NCYC 3082 / Yp74L-3) TaxID=1071383 RepID=J7R8B1_HUIN7|nr:hypothetical protein KNAG_0G00430 [Kazachstania naganishii CBS 8797]CCK71100.1 hypothetical protein KNAG_0G00430 [Kazachstania naganishii CBS 8797]